jgi:phage terminase Nu1 subunit (DNA packaging protein)
MASDPASPSVPSASLAKLFNLTDVRIQQLAKAGVCVKVAHGRYDLWASIKGYVKYLQERAVGRGVEGGSDDQSDYQKYRAQLYKARASKEAAQAALMVGKVHDGEIIEKVWGDMIANAKTRIMAIPTKAAGKVQSVLPLPQVEAILREPCLEALRELADYDPARLVAEFVAQHKDDADADADADEEETPSAKA